MCWWPECELKSRPLSFVCVVLLLLSPSGEGFWNLCLHFNGFSLCKPTGSVWAGQVLLLSEVFPVQTKQVLITLLETCGLQAVHCVSVSRLYNNKLLADKWLQRMNGPPADDFMLREIPRRVYLALFVLLEASPPILQNWLPGPGFVRLNPDSLPCVSSLFSALQLAELWSLDSLSRQKSHSLWHTVHPAIGEFTVSSGPVGGFYAVELWACPVSWTPVSTKAFYLVFGWPSSHLEQGSLVGSAVLWLTFFFLSCCPSRTAGLLHLVSGHLFTRSRRVLPRTPCSPVD